MVLDILGMKEYMGESVERVEINMEDGIKIVGTYYDNPSAKNGVILFPGFTEHRSSLEEIAKKLNKDFKTWTFDINSQGESSGNWDLRQMQKSVYAIQDIIRKRHGLAYLGAHGNSIGGMAVGLTAAQDEKILDCICMTSTPAGLQDIVPPHTREFLSYVPQSFIRFGTIVFDEIESRCNVNYQNKSHAQFLTEKGHQPYAQFGALKIESIKKLMQWVTNAPRLDDAAGQIKQPALLVYGGEDRLLGIKGGKLPDQIKKMYDELGSGIKELFIADGADHGLNKATKMDDCFNQAPEYQFVKQKIIEHFYKYLL
ncbi:MAG: alpha/beta fold hydrolase [Candidatus Woesearchaeota archaeon]|nr:alpha/beta fold hydrolase [Candidatus Woesearchaeota archaeon]